jgi:predicted dehydrogenase
MQVLLIALGRMGNRYKNALQRHFSEGLSLVTVDPKMPTDQAQQHYATLDEVPESIAFDLAIDARPNQDRLLVFQALLKRNIPHLIIEKPHAASLNESAEMLTLLKAHKNPPKVLMPFYERYGRHYQPDVLTQLDAGPLQSIVISSGAIGLGCNGIHFIDLANHLFQAEPLEVYAHLQTDSIPSPRGPQFMDHSGTLVVRYPEGKEFLLHMRPDSSAGCNITLLHRHGKIQILEQIEPVMHWLRQPKETWNDPFYRTHREAQIEPPCTFEKDLEDHMIPTALRDLLAGGDFPNIHDGHRALRVIALAMASHLERRPLAWQNDSFVVEELAFQFT